MLLTEALPESSVTQSPDIMMKTIITDEIIKLPSPSSELKSNDDDVVVVVDDDDNHATHSITAIKIPLVSFQPILATSPEYILANEVTKRRNQLVLFNKYWKKFTTRCFINETILDALWYGKQDCFLILTSKNVYKFDPNIKHIQLINDFIPMENKDFKSFTLLNESIILFIYDEWAPEYIHKWEEDNNNHWQIIERQPLKLTDNEFIGNISSVIDNNSTYITMTIYNQLTEQWRLEIRDTETLLREKSILLPGSNIMHDYRIISLKNVQSDIKWLVFTSANSNVIAMDSQWKKISLNYKHPVRRIAIFNENCLIVRTTEKIDIHLFI